MTVEIISLSRLAFAFIPAALVVVLMWYWKMGVGKVFYAMTRMLIQLLVIGYALVMIFESDSSLLTMAVLLVMLLASSWIALNTLRIKKLPLLGLSFLSLLAGGGITLCLITQLVLQLDPWYTPRYMIPLAGMIFANAMTSISLAGERFEAEVSNGYPLLEARAIAYRTSMIPIVNSLFAVGLVSLPGMMTGQILAGVEPTVAARYQIMVMVMLFAASGLSSALFLLGLEKSYARISSHQETS